MYLLLICIAGGCAVVYLHPPLASLLVYDRGAILAGELWRLFTCHLVHFSLSHLLFDLAGFLTAAGIIRQRAYRHLGLLCAVSALAVSGAIFIWQPGMAFYGGLSGIVNAAFIYAALRGVREERRWRWFCLAAIVLCIGNTLWEVVTGQPTLASPDNYLFVPVPLAHLVGALTGAAMAGVEARLAARPLLSPTGPASGRDSENDTFPLHGEEGGV